MNAQDMKDIVVPYWEENKLEIIYAFVTVIGVAFGLIYSQ